MVNVLECSFRDPSGFIFKEDGVLSGKSISATKKIMKN